MGLFDQFISVDIKKDMGIAGLTDEFFCVYLNNLLEKYGLCKPKYKARCFLFYIPLVY